MNNSNQNDQHKINDRLPVERLTQWNVVLFGDPEHSHNYVTTMLNELFAIKGEKGSKLAASIARTGRGVVMTTHKEYAEFKREQILQFGRDSLMDRCTGSMAAVIEPSDA
jgi:ATP-dependent Clp protease adaptor protein ClpS